MLDRLKGGAAEAAALFAAVLLAGMTAFWLAWFIAELAAMVGIGLCVGWVISHQRNALRIEREKNAALGQENQRLLRVMAAAQEQGVYAKPVIAEDVSQRAGLRLPFLGGTKRG